MKYRLYKLCFSTGVHFGKNSLEHTQPTFAADTLFSALCQEALHWNPDKLAAFLTCVKQNELLFSDALPYQNEMMFLPKPMLRIESKADDSGKKKEYKRLKYIPVALFDTYLSGSFPIERAGEWSSFGKTEMKVSASIRGEEETKPYRVAVYHFNPKCGLYILAGFANDAANMLFEELMERLSYSGIGGKRSSGLGKFAFLTAKMPEELERRLHCDCGTYMTLSCSLPLESEMEAVLEDASYLLEKRSGFVASAAYAPEQQKKRDIYVFAAGACFKKRFAGDVYDVSDGGAHPVYRYAKPVFLGVE